MRRFQTFRLQWRKGEVLPEALAGAPASLARLAP
jgi:hypothetical protein